MFGYFKTAQSIFFFFFFFLLDIYPLSFSPDEGVCGSLIPDLVNASVEG